MNEHVALLAYKLWEDRGKPLGSPEEDWFRAEQLLQVHPKPIPGLNLDGVEGEETHVTAT